MPRVAPMPWPDSIYHEPLGWTPAAFHNDFSRLCVPELSPRETKGALACSIALRAAPADLSFATLAGSSLGPITTKSLYITRRGFCSLPSAAYFFSKLGA